MAIVRIRVQNPKNMKKKGASPPKKQSNSIGEITEATFKATVHKSCKSSSWVKSHFLGRGSYGSVYLATSKRDHHKAIVAAIKSAELSHASSLMHEGRILTSLDSPFVISCYGEEVAREKTTNYNLILEYCSGRSVADLIETKRGGGLSEKDVKGFTRDILFGVEYIHSEGIIHCDLKPDNLLLSPIDKRVRPIGYLTKIADFGLAMVKGSIEYGDGIGHHRGTIRYMAPEHIIHGTVDYGVDTWALGCTVLEMLTGRVAWAEHGDIDSQELIHLIGRTNLVPYIPFWLSEEAQDFLSKCLVKDSGLRWKISALMDHPFSQV